MLKEHAKQLFRKKILDFFIGTLLNSNQLMVRSIFYDLFSQTPYKSIEPFRRSSTKNIFFLLFWQNYVFCDWLLYTLTSTFPLLISIPYFYIAISIFTVLDLTEVLHQGDSDGSVVASFLELSTFNTYTVFNH